MIAYTMMPGRGDMDLLLSKLADQLTAEGLRLCGAVQHNLDRDDRETCDMIIRTLPGGETYQISQDLGTASGGCRLDAQALEAAVAEVTSAFQTKGADMLLINKFGKHEAQGRGFRQLIADAVAQDIPVLVGLNELNKAAFLEFTGESAEQLKPSFTTLQKWIRDRLVVGAN